MEYDGKNNNYGEIRIIIRIINIMSINIIIIYEYCVYKDNGTYYKYYANEDNSIGFILCKV